MLRKTARSVEKITKEIKKTCEEMVQTMRTNQPKGVGLAGPQVGIPQRVFVMEPQPGSVFCIVNPQILTSYGNLVETEGCLSVPGIYYQVNRAEKIQVTYIDALSGKKERREFEKFAARIFQHELDHLNGVIFTDYCEKIDELEFVENIKIPPKLLERFKS